MGGCHPGTSQCDRQEHSNLQPSLRAYVRPERNRGCGQVVPTLGKGTRCRGAKTSGGRRRQDAEGLLQGGPEGVLSRLEGRCGVPSLWGLRLALQARLLPDVWWNPQEIERSLIWLR